MFVKGLSLLFLGVGVFLLVQVAMPFLAFKTWELFSYDSSQTLVDPISSNRNSDITSGNVLGVSIENINNFPMLISNKKYLAAPYPEFKITIPRLKLEKTKVLVNSNLFEQFLGHLPGTALPGERGNVFISGHSSITRDLDSKNKQAFFANLPDLRKGDLVNVEVLGQRLTYSVIGMKIVEPTDLKVLEPPDQRGRYLSLMTCVPPGFNTKRLVVLTKLKDS